MKTKKSSTKNRRKFSLLISMTTFFVTALFLIQLMFAPSMVQTVYAGSTLTPTSEPPPTNTPAPAPPATETPAPPPTNTPQSSGSGNSGGGSSAPAPTPTSIPIVPQEIPELGVGATWQPLIFTFGVLLLALMVAFTQVRYLLRGDFDE